MSKINSCKDCNKRTVGCHATCESYKKERADLDKINAEKRKGHFLMIDSDIAVHQRKKKGD